MRARSSTSFCLATSLVRIELCLVSGHLDCRIAARAGQLDLHGLFEELKAIDLLDGRCRGLGTLEDDKGLALGLHVGLSDDVDNIAELGEDGAQRFLERLGLDALLEVAHVDPVIIVRPWLAKGHERLKTWKRPGMCRSAMTHTWQ
jgi:hypothetical protein